MRQCVGGVHQPRRPPQPAPEYFRFNERAAHHRAEANGRRTGRPTVVDADKLEHAALLRDNDFSIQEIIVKTGLKRTALYR